MGKEAAVEEFVVHLKGLRKIIRNFSQDNRASEPTFEKSYPPEYEVETLSARPRCSVSLQT